MALVNNTKEVVQEALPGEYKFADSEIVINEGKESTKIVMENKGDRPIQIGSHFHLYEVNDAIKFFDVDKKEYPEREIVWGKRFDIPSSTSIRFEPGEKKEVEIIDIGGTREVYGMNNLVDGRLADGIKTPYSQQIAERHEHFKRGK